MFFFYVAKAAELVGDSFDGGLRESSRGGGGGGGGGGAEEGGIGGNSRVLEEKGFGEREGGEEGVWEGIEGKRGLVVVG